MSFIKIVANLFLLILMALIFIVHYILVFIKDIAGGFIDKYITKRPSYIGEK